MNFQVPQFIEQQPKIIGFLTLPQFLYVAAAAGVSFMAFYVFNFFLWLMVTVFVAAVAIGMAFVKINGQPLPKILLSAVGYVWQPRKFAWQRAMKEAELDTTKLEEMEAMRNSMNLGEKLKSLTMSVTTGKWMGGKNAESAKTGDKYQVVTFVTGEKKMAKKVDY